MPGDNLLDLSTLDPVRDTVTIDGAQYELAALDDFGAMEQIRLGGLYRRFSKLQDKDEPTQGEVVELNRLYDETLRLILPSLPEEYLGTVKVPKGKGKTPTYTEGKLRFTHKQRIVSVFTRGRRLAPTESRPTGATSSPDSAASTAPTTG